MSQNTNFPAIPPEQLVDLLRQSPLMNTFYDRAKTMMWSMVQYKELQMLYSCALKEIQTKFEILDTEFKLEYNRDPISSISTRLKRTESVMDKLERKGLPFTLESIEKNIHDMAGIRVICSYIDDIYLIADALLRQDDITLIARKDYIEHPKDNGYRSLHLIVEVLFGVRYDAVTDTVTVIPCMPRELDGETVSIGNLSVGDKYLHVTIKCGDNQEVSYRLTEKEE